VCAAPAAPASTRSAAHGGARRLCALVELLPTAASGRRAALVLWFGAASTDASMAAALSRTACAPTPRLKALATLMARARGLAPDDVDALDDD